MGKILAMPSEDRASRRSDTVTLAVRYHVWWLVLLAVACLSGCAITREPSRTARTAVEQLLISQALERSVSELALPLPAESVLYVEVTGLTRLSAYAPRYGAEHEGELYGPLTDLVYVRDVIASRLGEQGFRIARDARDAEYLVRVVVDALGTEQGESFFGMPPVQSVLLPFALPELTLYKEQDQRAYLRWSIDIYERTTGRFVRSTPVYRGQTYYNMYTLLLIFRFKTTDLILPP